MKARYMMDTYTCIYLKNRRPASTAERFSRLSWGEVVMSLITYGELYSGALKSVESTAALNNLSHLSKRLPVQAMSIQVAETYADIRSDLEKKGQVIGGNDLWIAAHALTLDLTLITNNTGEFSRVDGLSIENWV